MDDKIDVSIAQSKLLAVGEAHHRSYVGPPEKFDVIGATQFSLAVSLGLREEHCLLDLGCGSLRAGRFFLTYLLPEKYFGIEPHEWLWERMIKSEIGQDLIDIKKPRFDDNDQFDCSVFDTQFDMVIANSIFSHTGADLFLKGLRSVKSSLKKNGQFVFTIMPAGQSYSKRFPSGMKSEGWFYPGCATYRDEEVLDLCKTAGLQAQKIPWAHPTQTWFRAVLNPSNLLADPKTTFRNGLTNLRPRMSR